MKEAPVARGKPAEYGQEIVRRRHRMLVDRIVLRGRTVLDFGCGNGAQTASLLDEGCSVIGVDIDAGDLQILAGYARAGSLDSVLAVRYDGVHLPVRSGSIDAVICFEVLEHVKDESATLGEIWRTLKPGGDILVTVPNKWWVFETHGAYLPILPWNRVPFFSWLPASIHRRFAKARIYRWKDITGLLTAHSFDVLDSQYVTAPLDVLGESGFKQFLQRTLFRGDTTRWGIGATAVFVHGRKRITDREAGHA